MDGPDFFTSAPSIHCHHPPILFFCCCCCNSPISDEMEECGRLDNQLRLPKCGSNDLLHTEEESVFSLQPPTNQYHHQPAMKMQLNSIGGGGTELSATFCLFVGPFGGASLSPQSTLTFVNLPIQFNFVQVYIVGREQADVSLCRVLVD